MRRAGFEELSGRGEGWHTVRAPPLVPGLQPTSAGRDGEGCQKRVTMGAQLLPRTAEARPRGRMEIAWSDEDGAYLVTVPEPPGCVTRGATCAEAPAWFTEGVTRALLAVEHLPVGGQTAAVLARMSECARLLVWQEVARALSGQYLLDPESLPVDPARLLTLARLLVPEMTEQAEGEVEGAS